MGINQSVNGPTGTIDGVRVGKCWSNVVLSAKSEEAISFGIYPNPSNLGYMNIRAKKNFKMNAEVFDILGKKLLSQNVLNEKMDV